MKNKFDIIKREIKKIEPYENYNGNLNSLDYYELKINKILLDMEKNEK